MICLQPFKEIRSKRPRLVKELIRLGSRDLAGPVVVRDVSLGTARIEIVGSALRVRSQYFRQCVQGDPVMAQSRSSEARGSQSNRDVKSDQIPEVVLENGTKIKLVCGEVAGTRGPVRDIVIDPEYLDVSVPFGTEFIHPTKPGHTVFAYVTEGRGYFSEERDSRPLAENRTLLVFEDGEQIKVTTEASSVRFLLISGRPIGEPVAWYGPIVMNTDEELDLAFREYQDGTFIKHKRP